ncbi:DUF1622 domain-containing protein [Leptolyngbya sp. O-77]|uniref:DUF1622 domain-containing protein n=1 Tax=Leptolyngbya sp. O-77 TaxID=1080068 RepID=UPI00074D4CB1|nr:DUF1622 domain-containing protein [Leptolyngbya sp. O-77]BAU40761.1 hypothetical protein O77CONTIG1_00566 [Leptolyngbya sp. O-77]
MLVHLLAADPLAANSSFIHRAEFLLQEMAMLLKIILEFIAILIVAIALVQTIRKYVRSFRYRGYIAQPSIRLDLGLSLALALEFLLAADIVGTAVSPRWNEIAKLAAITGIRTFLNYFLHREVRELQESPNVAQAPQTD